VVREIEREIARLYESHAPGLFRYAGVLAEDRETARDALKEVFVRYYILRAEGRAIDQPKTWLYRGVRDHLKGFLKAYPASGGEEAVGEGKTPSSQSELAARLVMALPVRELECAKLRGHGLSYGEIAVVLDVQVATVSILLARAHKKMRQVLAAGDPDPIGSYAS
jgi:RNA polymerase sigma factor (sigma-70 family)